MVNPEVRSGEVSFYQTNLVCRAATDIGCGTRAKPILLEFMRNDAVKGAFLNHAGTVIAVVWNEGIKDKLEIANNVFSVSNQPFLELVGDSREEQLSDFQNKGPWYKGKEVNKLSVIEAERMADQMTSWIAEEPYFSENDKAKLHRAFEEYIRRSLLVIEDAEVLKKTEYWRQWESDLTKIGREVIGDAMPDMQMVPGSAGEECTTSKSCCTKEDTLSCCRKSDE